MNEDSNTSEDVLDSSFEEMSDAEEVTSWSDRLAFNQKNAPFLIGIGCAIGVVIGISIYFYRQKYGKDSKEVDKTYRARIKSFVSKNSTVVYSIGISLGVFVLSWIILFFLGKRGNPIKVALRLIGKENVKPNELKNLYIADSSQTINDAFAKEINSSLSAGDQVQFVKLNKTAVELASAMDKALITISDLSKMSIEKMVNVLKRYCDSINYSVVDYIITS